MSETNEKKPSTELMSYEDRQRLVETMVSDLANTLNYKLAEVTRNTAGSVQRSISMLKNAMVGLVVMMLMFVMKTVVISLAGSSKDVALQSQNMLDLLNKMMGAGMAMLGMIVVIMFAFAAFTMITGGTSRAVLGAVIPSRRREQEQKLANIREAVAELVGEEMATHTSQAIDDAYAISQALENDPHTRGTQSQVMAQVLGQTILAGTLSKEVDNYASTRWHADGDANENLKKLETEQDKVIQELHGEKHELHTAVKESAAQFSQARAEITQIGPNKALKALPSVETKLAKNNESFQSRLHN